MKGRICTALLVSALFGSPVLAADLPVKAPRPAPAPAVADWTGFYIGVHGGWGWAKAGIDDVFLDSVFIFPDRDPPRFDSPKLKGWLVGGHAGYNWQSGRFVGGLEIDFSHAEIDETVTLTRVFEPFPRAIETRTGTLSAEIAALANVRARAGFLLTPEFLIYGTGGLAWARTEATFTRTDVLDDRANGGFVFTSTETSRANEDHFGWVAGAGGEWRLWTSGWSLRAEYLHYDFGRTTHAFAGRGTFVNPPTPTPFTTSFNVDSKLTVDVVRGGLSYKF